MKLLVLSLCLVAALATKSAQFGRQQELEDALDDLANEIEEIVAAEALEKGLSVFLFCKLFLCCYIDTYLSQYCILQLQGKVHHKKKQELKRKMTQQTSLIALLMQKMMTKHSET